MNSFNGVGTLTKDSELKYTAGKGTPMLNFTIAINRGFKKEDGVDFIPCILWGSLAEKLAEFYVKGLRVSIQGELRIDSNKDDNGNYKTYTKILVDKTKALSNKKREEDNSSFDTPTDNADNGALPW